MCVNELVLIVDNNTPRGYWPLEKVIDVTPGPDNVVRRATVKPKSDEYVRPVSKLC